MFEPHVTLIGDINARPETSADICREIFSGVGPIRAGVASVERSDAWFMSLYLNVSLHPNLKRSVDMLSTMLFGHASSPFRPHISLAYGPLPGAEITDEVTELIDYFIDSEILLDRLVIAHSAKALPVNSWTTLYEVQISGT